MNKPLTYEQLLSDLHKAYHDAAKNKRYTVNEIEFEVLAPYLIRALANQIWNFQYHPSGGIAFLSFKPTLREIFGASFIDRIVHHYLYNKMYDYIDRRLDPDSYSCRIGKGTLYGIRRMQRYINLVGKDAYVIKFDLSGYFMSLPRKQLYELVESWLKRQYPEYTNARGKVKRDDEYYLVKYLWKEVIMDEPTLKAKLRGAPSLWAYLPWSKSLYMQPPGTGMLWSVCG